MKVQVFLFVFCGLILAISSEIAFAAQDCEKVTRLLIKLESSDPIDEAEKAIESGSLKFLGVYGYALSVPGVGDAKYYACYSKTLVAEGIEGTTDFLRCPDHPALNAMARSYAEKFNKRILQHLKKIGFRCSSDKSLKRRTLQKTDAK